LVSSFYIRTQDPDLSASSVLENPSPVLSCTFCCSSFIRAW
jgi:hypothetical protein